MKPPIAKIGRITVAIGLVGFGLALLVDNLVSTVGAVPFALKLWPLILIGFGLEYMIRNFLAQRSETDVRLRFDFGGAVLLFLVIMLSAGITSFRTFVMPNLGHITLGFGPSESRNETKTISAANVKELAADVDLGSVTIQTNSKADEIRVEATYTTHGFSLNAGEVRGLLDQIKLSVTEGETVKIKADIPSGLNDISLHYDLYVPANLKVKTDTGAGSIQVTNYKGDLTLTSRVGRIGVDASAGSLTASSGAGSIQVRNFQGPVTAHTNVGSLNVDSVVGALQLDSGTGSINVQDFQGGKLVAETRTGGIHASTRANLEGDVNLKAQMGSISLDIPRDSSIRATAQTRTGSLSTPGFMSVTRNGTASSAVGTNGDGKYTVTLEAGTGSVHLQMQ